MYVGEQTQRGFVYSLSDIVIHRRRHTVGNFQEPDTKQRSFFSLTFQGQAMTLCFPNPSRSFDVGKNCIFFWGYDSVIEISFHIEVNALKKLCPEMSSSEAGFLQAFDTERKRIYKVANNVYVRGGNNSKAYTLVAGDF